VEKISGIYEWMPILKATELAVSMVDSICFT